MMPGHWLPLRKNNLQRRLPANRRSEPTPFPLQTDLNQSKIPPANNSPDGIGLRESDLFWY